MAQHIQILLIDESRHHRHRDIQSGLDGVNYEIDVSGPIAFTLRAAVEPIGCT